MQESPRLRDYQARDAERIRDAYRAKKRAPLYVAPCGAGKTILFSYVTQGANRRGHKVLLLCHRTELIDQISAALTAWGVEHGYIAAGYPHIRGHSVYVASVFSLVRRLDLFTPDLIVVDEAHHTSASTWEQILKANPKARLLGVTATPVRATGSGLGEFYDSLIIGPSYEELTNAGYLTPIEIYAPPVIDSSGLHVRAGEYVQSEVVQRADKPTVTGDAIRHYIQHCAGKRAIVFDVSVDAARKRAAAFRDSGFKSEAIDGTLSREVRSMAIAGFRRGDIQVLTSCNLVTEGFDLPAIEVGIDLTPTKSLANFLQRAGRVLRPMEGKSVALYFDHARNVERFGFPTEAREWSLADVPEGADSAKSQPGVRICKSCYAVSPAWAKTCKACGEAFKVEGRKIKQKEGELKKLTVEEARALAKKKREARERGFDQYRAQSYEALVALGKKRGMNNPEGWAKHILDARTARGRQ